MKKIISAFFIILVISLSVFYWSTSPSKNESKALDYFKKRMGDSLIDFENLKTFTHEKYENGTLVFQMVSLCGEAREKITYEYSGSMYLKRNFVANIATISHGKELDESAMGIVNFHLEHKNDNFSVLVYEESYNAFCRGNISE